MQRRDRRLAVVAACAALGATAAPAARADAPSPCPGDAINAERVIEGKFDSDLEGAYVLVGFHVPPKTTAVRVKYCYDQPEAPTSAQLRHTLDIGLYEPTRKRSRVPAGAQFRGWSGSGFNDVTVSPRGFPSEVGEREPGRTSRSYHPGPIPSGRWTVEPGWHR